MSSANVLPSAPPQGVETTQQYVHLYPNLPSTTTNAENFQLTEISKIDKPIADEVEHYRLKKYKKVRKVIHYAVAGLSGATAVLSSGAVVTSLTGVGIVVGAPPGAIGPA